MQVRPKLPLWQQQLVDSILRSLADNYIFYDRKKPEMWRDELEKEFAEHFSHLHERSDIITDFQKKFANQEIALYLEPQSMVIDQNYIKNNIDSKDLNAIILVGSTESKCLYCVCNGQLVTDNLLKFGDELISYTEVIAPDLVLTKGKIDPLSRHHQEIIESAIQEAALTSFAEKMSYALQRITHDDHFSVGHYPAFLAEVTATERFKQEKTFGPGNPMEGTISKDVKDRLIASKGIYGVSDQPQEPDIHLPSNFGYLSIKEIFNPQQPETQAYKQRVFNLMKSMTEKDAIIIDLRKCPGGTPLGVQYLASFFFANPTSLSTYYTRQLHGGIAIDRLETLAQNKLAPNEDETTIDLSQKEIVILIGQGTFSAAEEFAYDMQHLGRATIVGTRSHGGNHFSRGEPLLNSNKTDYDHDFHIIVPRSYSSVNPDKIQNWEDTPQSGKPGVEPTITIEREPLAFAVTHLQQKLGHKSVTAPEKSLVSEATLFPLAKQHNLSVSNKMFDRTHGATDDINKNDKTNKP